jgi:hypothetical protein
MIAESQGPKAGSFLLALLAFSRSPPSFLCTMTRQKHAKNVHFSRNNSPKTLGFSCF